MVDCIACISPSTKGFGAALCSVGFFFRAKPGVNTSSNANTTAYFFIQFIFYGTVATSASNLTKLSLSILFNDTNQNI